jgi:hypothetical protein
MARSTIEVLLRLQPPWSCPPSLFLLQESRQRLPCRMEHRTMSSFLIKTPSTPLLLRLLQQPHPTIKEIMFTTNVNLDTTWREDPRGDVFPMGSGLQIFPFVVSYTYLSLSLFRKIEQVLLILLLISFHILSITPVLYCLVSFCRNVVQTSLYYSHLDLISWLTRYDIFSSLYSFMSRGSLRFRERGWYASRKRSVFLNESEQRMKHEWVTQSFVMFDLVCLLSFFRDSSQRQSWVSSMRNFFCIWHLIIITIIPRQRKREQEIMRLSASGSKRETSG